MNKHASQKAELNISRYKIIQGFLGLFVSNGLWAIQSLSAPKVLFAGTKLGQSSVAAVKLRPESLNAKSTA